MLTLPLLPDDTIGACSHFYECRFLHGNDLSGTLPAAWAQPGSYTVLKYLTLSDNPRMSGPLPAEWGAATQGGALSQLRLLNASCCGLSGPLPAWGAGLQSLETL